MKVIALLPFKNEQWCLPAYLHNTSKFVDYCASDGKVKFGKITREIRESDFMCQTIFAIWYKSMKSIFRNETVKITLILIGT